jgi:hypothetical protein
MSENKDTKPKEVEPPTPWYLRPLAILVLVLAIALLYFGLRTMRSGLPKVGGMKRGGGMKGGCGCMAGL